MIAFNHSQAKPSFAQGLFFCFYLAYVFIFWLPRKPARDSGDHSNHFEFEILCYLLFMQSPEVGLCGLSLLMAKKSNGLDGRRNDVWRPLVGFFIEKNERCRLGACLWAEDGNWADLIREYALKLDIAIAGRER
jgi:hypothetical protein